MALYDRVAIEDTDTIKARLWTGDIVYFLGSNLVRDSEGHIVLGEDTDGFIYEWKHVIAWKKLQE